MVVVDLLFGEGNLHCVARRQLKAVERFPGGATLQLAGKLYERNVVTVRHQTHFFEAGELVEEHRQHHLVCLLRQVGQEQNLVGRLLSRGGGFVFSCPLGPKKEFFEIIEVEGK